MVVSNFTNAPLQLLHSLNSSVKTFLRRITFDLTQVQVKFDAGNANLTSAFPPVINPKCVLLPTHDVIAVCS